VYPSLWTESLAEIGMKHIEAIAIF